MLDRGGQIIRNCHGLHLQRVVDTLRCIANENNIVHGVVDGKLRKMQKMH